MTSRHNTVLYTGVTRDLKKRVAEHKQKLMMGFTKKYNVEKLVYFEMFESIKVAIAREKNQGRFPAKENRSNTQIKPLLEGYGPHTLRS